MLKDIALLVQIAFYIIGATIAILTYRSAKRGLLNTVNTEYHKRVIDHLEKLSETLYSEFDPDSDSYIARSFNINRIARERLEVHNQIHGGKYPQDLILHRVELTELESKLYKLIKELKSSPFLPDHIVNYTVEYLTGRVKSINDIKMKYYFEILHKEMKKDGIIPPEGINHLVYWFEQSVRYGINKSEYGEEEVEMEVHKIRTMIKDYLKSFNPLP